MTDEPYYPGLEGVVAGETAISSIEGGLMYRGYPIEELADGAQFPEVAYLLLHGDLPTQDQLADFQTVLAEQAELPVAVANLVQDVPPQASPMDVLRSGISALAHFDPRADDDSPAAAVKKAIRLLAQIPLIMGQHQRIKRDLPPLEYSPEFSFAGNLLNLLTGAPPSEEEERAMDVSLILYAEHEFNASTFTARTITSTGSDLYSAITGAVGALKGPLHGGANERVMAVLDEVGSPENADEWVRQALVEKRRIMGFGHRVYKTGDPRAVILKQYCQQLAGQAGNTALEEIAETIERVVTGEKGLPPNLDWPSARLYHYMGLEVELYTPLFVVSRVVGWSAHVIEQAQNNRLIRPRSQYIGPEIRKFVPLEERE